MDDVSAKLQRVLEIKQTLDSVKPLYEELEQITLSLLTDAASIHGYNHLQGFGHVFTIVDNFQEKNTVYRPAAVKRFELKVETEEEYQASLEKALKKAEKAKK